MSEISELPLSSSQDNSAAMRSGVKPASRSGARSGVRSRLSSWLPWRQWLVLFTMSAVIIGIEVHNHRAFWQRPGNSLNFWSDGELHFEIVLYGIVLPILAVVGLGILGRAAGERNKMAREQELRRMLVGQLQEAGSWRELAELVVSTPGAFVSADRAWLLAQRSSEEQFEQIAHWERLAPGFLPPYAPVSPGICESCAESPAPKGTRMLTCDHPGQENNDFGSTRYCLGLSSKGMGKTMLLFDLSPDRPLDPGQIKLMDDIGAEMSLAIDNANLQYQEQRQGDLAKNERMRIARDLHDTLGQNISYLRLKLEQLNTTGPGYDSVELQEDLARMLQVAEEAYEQVRNTLEELRTTEHRELEEDVRPYAAQVSERTGFSVHVNSSGTAGDLSCRQNRELMYIIREALNNVEKHAGAHNVDIKLQWCESDLKVTVGDDGQGFQLEKESAADHYGMAIMKERALSINAALAIESVPGKGTEISVSLPLTQRAVVASRI